MYIRGLDVNEDYKRQLILELQRNIDSVEPLIKGSATVYVVTSRFEEAGRLIDEYCDLYHGANANEIVDGFSVEFSDTEDATEFYNFLKG